MKTLNELLTQAEKERDRLDVVISYLRDQIGATREPLIDPPRDDEPDATPASERVNWNNVAESLRNGETISFDVVKKIAVAKATVVTLMKKYDDLSFTVTPLEDGLGRITVRHIQD